MYLPRRFAETDLAALDGLFARDAFVTLVTNDADGQPTATHLPVLYRRDAGHIEVRGHWARPNPQARHAGKALLIVHGPHAYISPTWYARPEDRVPTWNYTVAHLQGQLETTGDIEALRAIVSELSAHYEGGLRTTWTPQHGHPEFEPELRGIIGFRFVVESVQMKFKLNQHYDSADVRGAVAGLRAGGAPLQIEIADLMDAHLARRPPETTP